MGCGASVSQAAPAIEWLPPLGADELEPARSAAADQPAPESPAPRAPPPPPPRVAGPVDAPVPTPVRAARQTPHEPRRRRPLVVAPLSGPAVDARAPPVHVHALAPAHTCSDDARLDALPHELLELVARRLDARDLCALRAVSRGLRDALGECVDEVRVMRVTLDAGDDADDDGRVGGTPALACVALRSARHLASLCAWLRAHRALRRALISCSVAAREARPAVDCMRALLHALPADRIEHVSITLHATDLGATGVDPTAWLRDTLARLTVARTIALVWAVGRAAPVDGAAWRRALDAEVLAQPRPHLHVVHLGVYVRDVKRVSDSPWPRAMAVDMPPLDAGADTDTESDSDSDSDAEDARARAAALVAAPQRVRWFCCFGAAAAVDAASVTAMARRMAKHRLPMPADVAGALDMLGPAPSPGVFQHALATSRARWTTVECAAAFAAVCASYEACGSWRAALAVCVRCGVTAHGIDVLLSMNGRLAGLPGDGDRAQATGETARACERVVQLVRVLVRACAGETSAGAGAGADAGTRARRAVQVALAWAHNAVHERAGPAAEAGVRERVARAAVALVESLASGQRRGSRCDDEASAVALYVPVAAWLDSPADDLFAAQEAERALHDELRAAKRGTVRHATAAALLERVRGGM